MTDPPHHHADHPPQIENETLNIHDKQEGTEGGAPISIALLLMIALFAVAAIVTLLLMIGGNAATAPAVTGQ